MLPFAKSGQVQQGCLATVTLYTANTLRLCRTLFVHACPAGLLQIDAAETAQHNAVCRDKFGMNPGEVYKTEANDIEAQWNPQHIWQRCTIGGGAQHSELLLRAVFTCHWLCHTSVQQEQAVSRICTSKAMADLSASLPPWQCTAATEERSY